MNLCNPLRNIPEVSRGTLERPIHKAEEKVPFIPLESELDELIAALSRIVAVVSAKSSRKE